MVAADQNREGMLRRIAARKIGRKGKITDSFVDSSLISNREE
jgi:hypothetical protein